MTAPCRDWWRNCALEADAEMLDIDAIEDRLAPIGAKLSGIRELISSLELCHHKAEHWVYNAIEAIGSGESHKGLGTRAPGQHHPAETVWQSACVALAAWCAGRRSATIDISVGDLPAAQLLECLGERSPLKEWQVQRVIDKIRSLIHWPRSLHDPTAQYEWLLLGGGEYELAYRESCPERYEEHEEFWLTTVRTIIHDTQDGDAAHLSLGLAIDMLWPCHWRFVENLRIVLEAIGGTLEPATPFAACGRNIALSPLRPRMRVVSNTLRAFAGVAPSDGAVDAELLSLLGEPRDAKTWLALSLDKTIRLQLDPPADVRAISALTGPDWIGQGD
jgi:hypothetical protein